MKKVWVKALLSSSGGLLKQKCMLEEKIYSSAVCSGRRAECAAVQAEGILALMEEKAGLLEVLAALSKAVSGLSPLQRSFAVEHFMRGQPLERVSQCMEIGLPAARALSLSTVSAVRANLSGLPEQTLSGLLRYDFVQKSLRRYS